MKFLSCARTIAPTCNIFVIPRTHFMVRKNKNTNNTRQKVWIFAVWRKQKQQQQQTIKKNTNKQTNISYCLH